MLTSIEIRLLATLCCKKSDKTLKRFITFLILFHVHVDMFFFQMMSLKSRSTKSKIKVILDTESLRNITRENNNLLTYTLLTFVVVLALYLLTKDWKGFTAPEEIDLGSVRVMRHTIRQKLNRRKS